MSVREVLEAVARGSISVEEAERRLRLLTLEIVGDYARLDVGRELRRGVPEIVLGDVKRVGELVEIIRRKLPAAGRVIVSRVGRRKVEAIIGELKPANYRYEERARILVVYGEGFQPRKTGGRVAVLSGGTADIPVAEEARVVAEEMGCEVRCWYDVGVAALHRAIQAVREALEWGADAMIVAAGREAALASVVASLADVPVVGLPVSVGYGFAGQGLSALASMLQSCPLGLAVVNIDAGVAAGVFAAMVANAVARARAAGSKGGGS
ncbi:MAG: nickel pincer cofactor biosynthesis protein LarB [Thermofilaceae archaeon]